MGSETSAPAAQEFKDGPIKEASAETMTMRATLGAGCYWGTENYVKNTWGKDGSVTRSAVGFMGGAGANPSYDAVCSGRTGHVEVLDVDLADPKGAGPAVVYENLIRYFFQFHDPTTMNRQGNDAGTQYASVIFVYDEEQRRIATKVKGELQAHLDAGRLKAGFAGKTVSTTIVGAMPFYAAHNSHQDYLQKNPGGYCNHRIRFKAWPAVPEL